ncbi:MAG: VTT domain-containing protein [Candidatus Thorarchaeota archaeon]
MRVKRIDMIFIIVLIVITLFSIDFLINQSHREIIENISNFPYFQNLASGLLITFFTCLIGNLLPFPTPYTFVLCYSSLPFLSLNPLIPLLIGFIASIGCLLGELAGYFVGVGVSELISEDKHQYLKNYQNFLVNHPKIAPFLIFIFGLTPLNDDLITVPLGILRYNLKKIIFWNWLGKFGLMLIFSYNFLNICILLGGENWILSIITLYLLTIFVYIFIKIDIIEFMNKFFKFKAEQNI